MATVTDNSRTPGSELASRRFDAAIEDAIAERPSQYPNGASFVGADLPGLGAILAEYAREERPVVLVYPDGSERIIEPHAPVNAPSAA
jgi:hypothetical protein